MKTEGSNVGLEKKEESNYENTVTLSTEITFDSAGDVISRDLSEAEIAVNGYLSDAFLVPSISIKVNLE